MMLKMIIMYLTLSGEIAVHGEHEDRLLYTISCQGVEYAYAEEVVNWFIVGEFSYDEDLRFD